MDGEQGSTPTSRSIFQQRSKPPFFSPLFIVVVTYVVSCVLLAGGEQGSTPPLLSCSSIGGYSVGVDVERVGRCSVRGAAPLTIVACCCW